MRQKNTIVHDGSMDYPGAKREMRFGYNDWGALVSDESRGIEAIEYDSFGNPVHIKFSGRDYTKNVYSATGVKLATEHYTHPLQTGPIVMGDEFQPDIQTASTQSLPGIISPEHHLLAGQQKIEYRGPVIYRNFKIDMVLFPGGYATIGNDNAVTFHYYTQDYLGNNRAVVNGSTGAVEQTTAYYPYGAVIPDLGTGNSGQPFKFGGKELVNANGLNMYDFGARLHYPAIPQFDRIDPMCESYYPLSPYLYCANNPVNLIDKDGMDIWLLDNEGNLMNSISFDQFDMIAIQNQNDKTLKTWKGDYGSIKKQSSLRLTEETEFNLFECANDEIGTSVFEFLADNSSVEWSHIKTGADGETQGNFISTSHDQNNERSSSHLYKTSLSEAFIREDIHSHPSGNAFPSGMDDNSHGDIASARWLESRNKDVVCMVYCPPDLSKNRNKEYVRYHSRSSKMDFDIFCITIPELVVPANRHRK